MVRTLEPEAPSASRHTDRGSKSRSLSHWRLGLGGLLCHTSLLVYRFVVFFLPAWGLALFFTFPFLPRPTASGMGHNHRDWISPSSLFFTRDWELWEGEGRTGLLPPFFYSPPSCSRGKTRHREKGGDGGGREIGQLQQRRRPSEIKQWDKYKETGHSACFLVDQQR